eukprot:178106-Chlamydomonas_euryale.AAC.6
MTLLANRVLRRRRCAELESVTETYTACRVRVSYRSGHNLGMPEQGAASSGRSGCTKSAITKQTPL